MTLRCLLAWTFYGLGHAWYLVFDRWFPFGMRGPIYGVYNGLMIRSVRVQGAGSGPWLSADHSHNGWPI